MSEWKYSLDHRQRCRVLEVEEVWGSRFARIWLPKLNLVVRVSENRISEEVSSENSSSPDYLTFVATAAKLAECITQDVLLAPATSRVIPLPHQIRALKTAVNRDRVRFLLADEVGLGKTIEAGLIARELKLRGLVRRVLVVAPKGLCQQWVSEMETHFTETFQVVVPDDLKTMRRFIAGHKDAPAGYSNPWRAFDQVVCPMDSVKPMERRKGWTGEQIAEYNRERYDDLICAGWDLVIVDEAHRLGGATDQVARYKLGRGLAEASPYLLLLSATPHQGKTDGFRRLVSLLDMETFLDDSSITREMVSPFVIRTEKRHAVDPDGNPLFQPRQTRLIPVEWKEKHRGQETLYEAVTEYVRVGYNQAMREKRTHLGFLLVLMQRLVTSSTRAIRVSLERRLECLKGPEEQLSFFPEFDSDRWEDLDGQSQLEKLLTTKFKALKNEQAEVSLLLEAARLVESTGPDAKAEDLLERIYTLQQGEGDPELKVLIFTEFVPTQEMLVEFLEARGFTVQRLNGSMDMDERRRVQSAFRNKSQILISTDAGGEGLNLQFAHIIVNYDIPWNPMRLEQRIGRVDRIGQTHPVKALNFVLAETVEFRVREVLESKLAIILEEFGIDKTGDVLDSAEAESLFEKLYLDALIHPENLDCKVREVASTVSAQAADADSARRILGGDAILDKNAIEALRSRPVTPWVHGMVRAYARSHGGRWTESGGTVTCDWPDGEEESFTTTEDSTLDLLHPRVRELISRIPAHLDSSSPTMFLPNLDTSLSGIWSLWQIDLATENWRRHRICPLFFNDAGRSFGPTAQRIWESLISSEFELGETVVPFDLGSLRGRAMEATQDAFTELSAEHRNFMSQETERMERSFAARRRIIGRVGLDAVRSHRLVVLAEEESAWRAAIARSSNPLPDLTQLLVCHVKGGQHG